jgi:amino acid transporter
MNYKQITLIIFVLIIIVIIILVIVGFINFPQEMTNTLLLVISFPIIFDYLKIGYELIVNRQDKKEMKSLISEMSSLLDKLKHTN